MSNVATHLSDGRPRARGLGLPFEGQCGAANAITDVPGVEVGACTIIEEAGIEEAGETAAGAVRTGVTAILPRGKAEPLTPVWAGLSAFNGNGEMTGSHWIQEAGYFLGPVLLTNTHSVGMAHHAVTRWLTRHPSYAQAADPWLLPVVAETCDAHLNDMNGLHVREDHVRAALESAAAGPVAEGNVGGGTGMICYEFKGGTGTASRQIGPGFGPGLELGGAGYHVGALVQANFGVRPWLSVLGVPVGRLLTEDRLWPREQGSIIVVVATDAPLQPIQLQRVARRAGLGIGRTGTAGGNGSGDIFLAFSTASPAEATALAPLPSLSYLPNGELDPLFEATVQAVEEAVLNALVAAESMTGYDGNRVAAIDHGRLRDVMRAHGRLNDA